VSKAHLPFALADGRWALDTPSRGGVLEVPAGLRGFFVVFEVGGWNSAEFFVTESPGKKIPWNFSSQSLRERKFRGIFRHGVSRKENSVEFFVPETPGRKIPRNSMI
jgi:hypothetical protein